MRKHRWPAAGASAALAGLIAVLLPACSPTSFGPNTIVLYNGQHEQTTDALVAAFERATGISVRVHNGVEDALAAQIEEEGSASPTDVIYTENSPALMSLQEKGLLARLPGSVLGQVPAGFDSPSGDWAGVSARLSVLVYNPGLVAASELPSSVLGLAAPQWRRRLALAPTEADFQPVVTSIALKEGTSAAVAWLRAIKTNAGAHLESDNETVTADVDGGQAALGLIDQYYWYRLRAEVGTSATHSAIAYFTPRDPGYVEDVSGAAVLARSRHKADAEALVSFLVSGEGQRILTESDSFEYPLRPGTPSPPGLRPLGELQPAPVSVADLGDGSLALQLLQRVELL